MEQKLNSVFIEAETIPDAWFQCIWKLVDEAQNGRANEYIIERGSYEGEKRLEFDYITIQINNPCLRPFEPDIPVQYGIPNPVEPGYIESYLPYLMTAEKAENEQYTYGSRIVEAEKFNLDFESGGIGGFSIDKINQFEHWIDVLKKTPNTNQAVIQVAQPSDCVLPDPPCLRHIDMRIKDGKLNFYIYFRSWDLWGGFPANLGGLALVMEYLAMEIGVQTGSFICASKGLHLYRYVWKLAEIRTGKKIGEKK